MRPRAFVTLFIVSVVACLSLTIHANVLRSNSDRLGGEKYPANATEIARLAGYPAEEHKATTPDGFELTLLRLANPTGHPVFLQHGLGGHCGDWLLNTPSESLAYILFDNGYDVWLGNQRAVIPYSTGNVNHARSSDAYWAWSFDEMAKYDLPTQVAYVLQSTSHKKLTYVGHSQGCTQALAAFSQPSPLSLSSSPSSKWSDHIDGFIALAPAGYVYNIKVPLIRTLIKLDVPQLVEFIGIRDFTEPTVISDLQKTLCKFVPAICEDIVGIWTGYDRKDWNTSRTDYYAHFEPHCSSVQNYMHFAQLVEKNRTFGMYDFGSAEKNEKHYGQRTPPKYSLSDIEVPTAVFYGGKDTLADKTDVEEVMADMNSDVVVFNQFIEAYEHLDFIFGLDAKTLIYPNVLDQIRKFANGQ